MTMLDADSVPAYYPLNAPMNFTAGPLKSTIDPRNLDHGVLQRADLFVLRMIQDSWPNRPIYFARTSGSYAKQLGLGDNVITQGLAAKLFMPPGVAPKDSVYLQGDGWLDVATSDSLWMHTFLGPKSVLNTGDWIDRPSVGIPYLYVATGIELAEALKMQGKTGQANAVFNSARQVAQAVRLEDLLRGAETEFNQMTDTGAETPLPGAIPGAVPGAAPSTRESAGKPGTKPAATKPPATKAPAKKP
jgi:hypothetical protein